MDVRKGIKFHSNTTFSYLEEHCKVKKQHLVLQVQFSDITHFINDLLSCIKMMVQNCVCVRL